MSKPVETKVRCSRITNGNWTPGKRCKNAAKHVENGQHYCGSCLPSKRKAAFDKRAADMGFKP